MGLLKLTGDERKKYVATLLGYDPDRRDTWPLELIDRLLLEAEYEAELKLKNSIARLLGERAYRHRGTR